MIYKSTAVLKQQQYFDKKELSFYYNIALSKYLFIVILFVKIARLTSALEGHFHVFCILSGFSPENEST